MSKDRASKVRAWPVTWEAAREAQRRDMARSTPAQRLRWLEQSLRVAAATGALARTETAEKRSRRGMV
jgi:hypothetical protein